MFSKETQNKDQVEAAIVQDLTNDISSTIDGAPQAGEYDDSPIYEDPKVLDEGLKNRKIGRVLPSNMQKLLMTYLISGNCCQHFCTIVGLPKEPLVVQCLIPMYQWIRLHV